ncbi:hypothetical protein [Pelagibaculum spongiae]|uniref:Uncharacterized protein n=1 Tax=Pelagibaculum spongiae TaxID=2080658 RepID=A0A2V1GYQ3_9GAMM|nr:hypothetical protein [Pelagibaculum spongiae]PVZ72184.1 hypothetical protein DC094_03985 [Pelagibaculum spongiae]
MKKNQQKKEARENKVWTFEMVNGKQLCEIPEQRLFYIDSKYIVIEYKTHHPTRSRSYNEKPNRNIYNPTGRFDFVIKKELPHVIFLLPAKFSSTSGHTTIAHFSSVLFAGEIYFSPTEDYYDHYTQKNYALGELMYWNNLSGHYRCGPAFLEVLASEITISRQRVLAEIQTQHAKSGVNPLLPVSRFYPIDFPNFDRQQIPLLDLANLDRQQATLLDLAITSYSIES